MRSLVLGDSLEALIDHRGKTPKKLGSDFTADGVPVASAMLVVNGVLNLGAARYVSDETARKWMPTPTRCGDVLLTSEAPLGRVARVPSDNPLVLGQRLYGLRGKQGVLDTGFLYYALQSRQVQDDLLARSTGTTVLGIRQSALRKIEIPAPEFWEQQAIAEVLGALDDKITANTKLAATVDEYLAVLLRRELSSHEHEWGKLSDIANTNSESVKPKPGGNLRYIDITSVGVGSLEFPDISEWESAPSRARRRIRKGDTLWSTVRPNRRSHALNLSNDPLLVGSTGIAVITPRNTDFAYVYEVTRLPDFTTYLENSADGSAYPAVRSEKFAAAPVPILPHPARSAFEAVAAPLREYVFARTVESRTLAALRDALLPQFMSGKLRVKDAEKLVEEQV